MTEGARSARLASIRSLAIGWCRIDRATLALVVATAAIVGVFVVVLVDVTDDARASAYEDGLASVVDARLVVSVRSNSLTEVDASRSFGGALDLVDERVATLPPSIGEILGPSESVVDTPRFRVVGADGGTPASPTFVTMRSQSGYLDRSTVVAGRRAVDAPADGSDRTIEVELSVDTAALLGLGVGGSLEAEVDIDDSLTRSYTNLPTPFRLDVVGIVELTAPDEPAWFDDDRLHEPIVVDTGVGSDRLVMAAIPPASLVSGPFVVSGAAPFAAEQRSRVRTERVDASSAPVVRSVVRSLDATTGRTAGQGETAVITALGEVLDDIERERRSFSDLGSVAALGVIAAGVAALAAVVAARARRSVVFVEVVGRRGGGRTAIALGAAASGALAAALGGIAGAGSTAVVTGVRLSVVLAVVATVAIAAALAGGHSTARVASGVERFDVGGVDVARLSGRPRGWPRLRTAVELVVVFGAAAVLATLVGRSSTPVDMILLATLTAPPTVATFIVLRGVGTSVGRRAAIAIAVSIVSVGVSWALIGALDPQLDDTARRLAVASIVAIGGFAAAVGASLASAPGPDVAVGPSAEDGDPARRVGPITSIGVGVAFGVGWLAILLLVLRDRLDLVVDGDGVSPTAGLLPAVVVVAGAAFGVLVVGSVMVRRSVGDR